MERKSLVNVHDILAEQASEGNALEHGRALFTTPLSQGSASIIIDIVRKAAQGEVVHYMTNGGWSHYQLIVALQELTGPADLYVSSYAMSEASVRCLAMMQEQGLLRHIYAVIDNRIETRTAGSLQLLKSICSGIALVSCHAKVSVLDADNKRVLVMGSANYSENKRIETGIVTTSYEPCAFHKTWIKEQIQQHGRATI